MTRGLALVGSLLVLACTARGPLSAEGFSSGADEAEDGTPEGGSQDGPDSIGDDDSASSITTTASDDDSSDEGPTSTNNPDDEGPTSTNDPDDEGPTSNSESAESSPSSDGFETDDEGNWGIPPDVTNEPCAPLQQDCFPTHKCVPYSTVQGSPFLDANKCMPIIGDKAWGEPCTLSSFNEAQDDCDGTGFCWNLQWDEGQLHGVCVPFCTGTPQTLMCPAGWGCLFSGAVSLCTKQCDPLQQDCPESYGCYWTQNAFQCSLVGTPGGDLAACDKPQDCKAGFGCMGADALPGCAGDEPSCCTPWCDLDLQDPDPCPAPRECVAFFEQGQAPPGFQDVGVCVTP